MTYQGNENLSLFAKAMREQSDSEDDYEKCDHVIIFSGGFRTCLTCGEEVRERTMFVPEEGYQDRVAPLRTIQTTERESIQ